MENDMLGVQLERLTHTYSIIVANVNNIFNGFLQRNTNLRKKNEHYLTWRNPLRLLS